jgi:hypothetical protein
MSKLETEGKEIKTLVKEASASAKTASTNYGELKKKVDSHEKKLQK